MTEPLTRSELHKILDYDPVTHRLNPKPEQPSGMRKAVKNGKHNIIIGAKCYTMSKVAYVYHYGVLVSRVTHRDGNKDNYAPDNLVAYKPDGRADLAPIPDAIRDKDLYAGEFYKPILRPPKRTAHPPQVKFVFVYDEHGNPARAYTMRYARRLAWEYIKRMTSDDRVKLGMITPVKL